MCGRSTLLSQYGDGLVCRVTRGGCVSPVGRGTFFFPRTACLLVTCVFGATTGKDLSARQTSGTDYEVYCLVCRTIFIHPQSAPLTCTHALTKQSSSEPHLIFPSLLLSFVYAGIFSRAPFLLFLYLVRPHQTYRVVPLYWSRTGLA